MMMKKDEEERRRKKKKEGEERKRRKEKGGEERRKKQKENRRRQGGNCMSATERVARRERDERKSTDTRQLEAAHELDLHLKGRKREEETQESKDTCASHESQTLKHTLPPKPAALPP
eukprot:2245267-Rhodomonas_salina.3